MVNHMKLTQPNEDRRALVLLVLDGLRARHLTPIREYEFHQLVRGLQRNDSFRYLDRPLSYSYDLQGCLKQLDFAKFLDELILVRNGWVPRFEYAISDVGQAEAQDLYSRLQIDDPLYLRTIDHALDDFARNYQRPISINPH